jgi:hypothetical protein
VIISRPGRFAPTQGASSVSVTGERVSPRICHRYVKENNILSPAPGDNETSSRLVNLVCCMPIMPKIVKPFIEGLLVNYALHTVRQ